MVFHGSNGGFVKLTLKDGKEAKMVFYAQNNEIEDTMNFEGYNKTDGGGFELIWPEGEGTSTYVKQTYPNTDIVYYESDFIGPFFKGIPKTEYDISGQYDNGLPINKYVIDNQECYYQISENEYEYKAYPLIIIGNKIIDITDGIDNEILEIIEEDGQIALKDLEDDTIYRKIN